MSEGVMIGEMLKSKCTEPTINESGNIERFYAKYGCICPPVLVDLYKTFPGGFVERFPHESVLFYDAATLLEHSEALVPIDIVETGLMPIADFKDNQFLCYHPMKKTFILYSAIDGVAVLSNPSLSEILHSLFK